MSIMKYILFALLLLALWITEPLWFKTNTTTTSAIDEEITEQKKEKARSLTVEAQKQMELEAKFGPKPYGRYSTGVPQSVYKYWRETLKYPDSLEEERCGPIKASDKGWSTVCRYRVKNSSGSLKLMQDTFIIKNGVAYK